MIIQKNILKIYFEKNNICVNILCGSKENIMAKSKEDRISFVLKCSECGEENYLTSKNKKKHPDKLELNKYCPRCKKVTLHKEKKK